MKKLFTAAVAAGSLGIGQAWADDNAQPITLAPIEVTGTLNPPPIVTSPEPNPVTSITKPGLGLLGGTAQTSVYAPLDMVPSVLVQSPDPYGMSLSRTINIRGKDDFHISRTIDGLPVTGIVGGDMDMVDLENLERIDVYRSGLEAGEGLGVSDASGAVDSRILGPQDKFGATARQAFGQFDFYRSYARLDSGLLNDSGTKLFVSGSTANADKWTGPGDTSRDNLMLGFDQNIGDNVQINLNTIYNNFNGNTYRSLTYAQAMNPSAFYKYDYNAALTGNAATDANYYKYNKVRYETEAVFGDIKVKDLFGGQLDIKPYYSNDNGVQYSASGSNVQIWQQQNDNGGADVEYKFKPFSIADVTLGYWFQLMAAPPPPTDQIKYTATPSGGLSFASWATLAKMDDFEFNSPYVQIAKDLSTGTHVTGGVRYMNLSAPTMQWYKTSGLPNVSYDQIWAYHPAADTNAHVDGIDYDAVLPNFGITQKLDDAFTLAASYGRKFGRPDWGPQSSQFLGSVNGVNSEGVFLSKGVTLQSLMSSLRPELADQFDVSLRYAGSRLTITPTGFFSKHHNKEVLVSDPTIGSGISYYTSSGQTTEYGGELEIRYQLLSSLEVFGSGTLSTETFDKDLTSITGKTTLGIKGDQAPNAASQMLKLGVTYSYDGLSLSPLLRYVGKRFGDAGNTQPVGAYATADLYANYELGNAIGVPSLVAGMAVTNILDRRYIGEIVPPSNLENPSSTTAYYFGAPRTVSGYVSVKF